jgi:hypothetical protein
MIYFDDITQQSTMIDKTQVVVWRWCGGGGSGDIKVVERW